MQPPPVSDVPEFPRRLAEARAGSADALGQLWLECRNYLLLVANRTLASDLWAKASPSDVVQETFLEAQRDFEQFVGEHEEELLAWLCRILRNNIANTARRYRGTEMRAPEREVPLVGSPEAVHLRNGLIRNTPTPSDRVIAREDLLALEGAVACLPDHYQMVLRLRYVEQLSFAAIGEVMACSAEAARKLWARAVARLAQELKAPHATRPQPSSG
jgi:RNA polymerase sigma-70 factor (ECF subfamily)